PWLRARWFPRGRERGWQESVEREVKTVRSACGVCDVSTLGKIDIHGPDAGIFLDRVYINTFSTLPIGKARYGVMLREDGFVMDDGTVSRLADDHFYMTTTTANAAKVMQHLEFCHQVLWPELDVQMASVSEQWAQYSIAGPRARALLRAIIDAQFDLSDAALPYLGARSMTVCGGIEARVFRISYSGELAYELAVPARYGDALMRRLLEAGAPLGAIPYGTEALGVMRIEKGHPAGNELNGQTTAADLGLGKLMSKKKSFIGKVMAQRPALTDPDRLLLVGFKPVDRAKPLHAGAHFLAVGAPASPENDEGYLTSVAYSPTLDTSIGLGFLRRGPQRIGERVRAYNPVRNSDVEVDVCNPIFVDPSGERLHA
ncbi:MAG: glycine cleavage T C-terminal barrel domain-containing protein, partial [Terriglobia bacterium]